MKPSRRTTLDIAAVLLLIAVSCASAFTEVGNATAEYIWSKARGGYTVSERLEQYRDAVDARMRPLFDAAGVGYPPGEVAYIAFKDTRQIEIYARKDSAERWRYIRTYPIFGLSGNLGPKLLGGDSQVPEGIYRAEFLNPNSRFHLSIRLSYPNSLDRRMAQIDARAVPGSDIMIHGTSLSAGCLAVGNQAAEDFFILAALVTKENVRIIVSPTDFRRPLTTTLPSERSWVGDLYSQLRTELLQFVRQG